MNPEVQFLDVMASLDFKTIIFKTRAFVNSLGKISLKMKKKQKNTLAMLERESSVNDSYIESVKIQCSNQDQKYIYNLQN